MNHLQNSHLIAAAVGVTVGVITAAGICIYHKMLENQQHTTTNINLEAVNAKIAELQAQVEAIRLQENQRRKKRKSTRRQTTNESTYTATENDTDADGYSIAGTDIGDDEFYDCSDSESIQGENDIRNSEAMSELDLILFEIDKSVHEEFDSQVYYKLQNLVKLHPDNVEVAWRFARTCYKYSVITTDLNRKKSIIYEGIKTCENLLGLRHCDLYKWYAILVGVKGEFLPIADKIKNGYNFKDHVVLALEMRPNDSELHHLLGRFKYEVASLSWLERKVASTLFSEPPSASYEEALDSFHQAEQLSDEPNLENRLYLSKSFIALSNYDKAINWLEKILEVPASTSEHAIIHSEANKLLSKYLSYRL